MGAYLRLEGLTRRFGQLPALAGLTLEVERGEFLTILGPSGSGKTTTLNLIAGFDYPTEGEIHLDGRPITWEPAYRRGVGMVFQSYALFPHMTVADNVAFPLRMRHVGAAEIVSRVDRALARVRLGDLGARYPRQLSGGQQQRVALARAIVYEPSVLLMDEPLGALDRKLRGEMQFEIKRLHHELGTTVVYVTHDQDEALSMSDRIAVLRHGRLEQHASPRELYDQPATHFVAAFVGDASFLPATVVADGQGIAALVPAVGQTIPISRPRGLEAGDRVVVSVRPEHIRLGPPPADAGDPAALRVGETIFLGDAVKCELRHRAGVLIAKLPRGQPVPDAGSLVSVVIDAARCGVFREAAEGP
jgi:putative spermidine/putrescine transport system ATP-binding protein